MPRRPALSTDRAYILKNTCFLQTTSTRLLWKLPIPSLTLDQIYQDGHDRSPLLGARHSSTRIKRIMRVIGRIRLRRKSDAPPVKMTD
jgi:hypothetical protein